MNFMEMFLALMAIVLFTTISLVYNRSMWDQAENLDNVAKVIQATQLAHSRLDQIDAELLSQQIAFAQRQVGSTPPTVQQRYAPAWNTSLWRYQGTENVDLPYADYNFDITRVHEYTDSTGSTSGIPQFYVIGADYKYIKVTITVASTPGMDHPVFVSRVYTKTNFYLDY